DDLLAGGDRLDHLVAQRARLDPIEEVLGDLVVDVRLEQHPADLAEPVADHGLGEDPALAERPQDAVQLLAQLLEHRRPPPGLALPGAAPEPTELGKIDRPNNPLKAARALRSPWAPR